MDADAALADLHEVAPQLRAAVLLDESGEVHGATAARLADFARAARALIAAADELRRSQGRTLVRLRVVTRTGAVYAARGGPGWLAATADASAVETLVFYDLESCLRGIAESPGAAA